MIPYYAVTLYMSWPRELKRLFAATWSSAGQFVSILAGELSRGEALPLG